MGPVAGASNMQALRNLSYKSVKLKRGCSTAWDHNIQAMGLSSVSAVLAWLAPWRLLGDLTPVHLFNLLSIGSRHNGSQHCSPISYHLQLTLPQQLATHHTNHQRVSQVPQFS